MEKHAGWLEVQQAPTQPPRLGTRPLVPWPLGAQAAPTIPCAQPTSFRMAFELSLCAGLSLLQEPGAQPQHCDRVHGRAESMNEQMCDQNRGCSAGSRCEGSRRGRLEMPTKPPPWNLNPDVTGFFVARQWLSNLNLCQAPEGSRATH